MFFGIEMSLKPKVDVVEGYNWSQMIACPLEERHVPFVSKVEHSRMQLPLDGLNR